MALAPAAHLPRHRREDREPPRCEDDRLRHHVRRRHPQQPRHHPDHERPRLHPPRDGCRRRDDHSNPSPSTPKQGSIGTIPNPIVLVLVEIFHTGEVGVPAVLKPVVLDAEAGHEPLPRRHDAAPRLARREQRPIAPVIGPIKAGVGRGRHPPRLRRGHRTALDVGDIRTSTSTTRTTSPRRTAPAARSRACRPRASSGPTDPCAQAESMHRSSSAARSSSWVSAPTSTRSGRTSPSATSAPATTSRSSTRAVATEITVTAYTDVRRRLGDDETGASHGVANGVGKIDVLTNGSIVVVEQSSKGDLRVGHIHATGLCSGANPKACTTGDDRRRTSRCARRSGSWMPSSTRASSTPTTTRPSSTRTTSTSRAARPTAST